VLTTLSFSKQWHLHLASLALLASLVLSAGTLETVDHEQSIVAQPLRPTFKGLVLFRLGSGAWSDPQPATPHSVQAPMRTKFSPHLLCVAIPSLFVLSMLNHMMPGHSGGTVINGRDFNYRIPPAWSPEREDTCSFRSWMTDISV
jgi:hypothetical protein